MKRIVAIVTILASITGNIVSSVRGPINFEIYNKSDYSITKIEIMQELSVVEKQRKQNLFEQLGNVLSKPTDLVTIMKSNDKRPVMPMQFFEAQLPIGKDSFFLTIVSENKNYSYRIRPCFDQKCAKQIFLTFNPHDPKGRPPLRPQTGKFEGWPQFFGISGTTESGKEIKDNVEQENITRINVKR